MVDIADLREKSPGESMTRQEYNTIIRTLKELITMQNGQKGGGFSIPFDRKPAYSDYIHVRASGPVQANAIFNLQDQYTLPGSGPDLNGMVEQVEYANSRNVYMTNEDVATTSAINNINARPVGNYTITKVEVDDEEPDNTPIEGTVCGVEDGSWQLTKNGVGLFCLKRYQENSKQYADVIACGVVNWLVKAQADVTKDTVGTFIVYEGTPGTETISDPELEYEAVNKTGKDIVIKSPADPDNDALYLMLDINGARYVVPISGVSASLHIFCPSPGVAAGGTIPIVLPGDVDPTNVTNWTGAFINSSDRIRVMQDSSDDLWYMIKGEDSAAAASNHWWGTVGSLNINVNAIGAVNISSGAPGINARFWANSGIALAGERIFVWKDPTDSLYYFIKGSEGSSVKMYRGFLSGDMLSTAGAHTCESLISLIDGTNIGTKVAFNTYRYSGEDQTPALVVEDNSSETTDYLIIDVQRIRRTQVINWDWNLDQDALEGTAYALSFQKQQTTTHWDGSGIFINEQDATQPWHIIMDGAPTQYVNTVDWNGSALTYTDRTAVVFEDEAGSTTNILTPISVPLVEDVKWQNPNLNYAHRTILAFPGGIPLSDVNILTAQPENVIDNVEWDGTKLFYNEKSILVWAVAIPDPANKTIHIPVSVQLVQDVHMTGNDLQQDQYDIASGVCQVWTAPIAPTLNKEIIPGTDCP